MPAKHAFMKKIAPAYEDFPCPYRLGSISVALSSTVVFLPEKELGTRRARAPFPNSV